MSKKDKLIKLTISLSDENNLKYIMNAYGLFTRYRTLNQQPVISVENWLAANLIEASKHLYTYHAEQIAALKKLTEEAEKAKVPTAENSSQVSDETADKVKEAVNAINSEVK